MDTMQARIADLRKHVSGYWADRALAQLDFADRLSAVRERRYDGVVEAAAALLDAAVRDEGAVTKPVCQAVESALAVAGPDAKALRIVCVSHAHIDMNWLWGYPETVAVTLDTFRTILRLMEEYPDFTYAQSQASVYRIVEEQDPALLQEIARRVREGRWEVTASTWVETDKNMPSGESLARHILYTKRYFQDLFGLDPDSLDLDYEPDTFGHSANVPEILARGGVRHYYHNRGYDGFVLYRWQSPSGRQVVVYRDPYWYNATIDATIAAPVPAFCAEHGLDTALKVYGVGDHGGGPTRRDLERLIDMNAWPVFPTLQFGTYAEFFRAVDRIADRLPVVDHELNFIFTGCYTTQTRIKAGNRIAEARMNEAEAFSAAATDAGVSYPAKAYADAWERILFNHFHDILPGSGITETREYAMGQFQQTLAAANTGLARAIRGIAAEVDTASLPGVQDARTESAEDLRWSISEGGGVGFAVGDFGVPQPERGTGKVRILHFFNPSPHPRRETVSATVWDWPGDRKRIEIVDEAGKIVPFQVEPGSDFAFFGKGHYWGHEYFTLSLAGDLPPFGYATYVLRESGIPGPDPKIREPRVEVLDPTVLENEVLRADFDPVTAGLRSLVDKRTGRELLRPGAAAGFRLIDEDDARGMTAWVIGRYMAIEPVADKVRMKPVQGEPGALRQVLEWTARFRGSSLKVAASLAAGSDRLEFNVTCDFRETAVVGQSIPQLNFHAPLGYGCRSYRYDIPFGLIDREPVDMDVPGNSFILGVPGEAGSPALGLVAATKYGFRGVEDGIALTLIRSSHDPDPTPEFGEHRFRFALMAVANPDDRVGLLRTAHDFCHPALPVPGSRHAGTRPGSGSFLSVEGGVFLSAVKLPEGDVSGLCWIVRLYGIEGKDTTALLRFSRPVRSVKPTDLLERPLAASEAAGIRIAGDRVECPVGAFSVLTLRVEFGE